MAWNEPGGGGKDPWGNRGDQGPPDLDEAFKKLQAQLSGIFGGGSGGGSSGLSPRIFGLILVVLLIVYGLAGLYQIDQGERGVVFRFGAVQKKVVMPGLHWNPPLVDDVQKVNVTRVNSNNHQALMLTEDENIVDVAITVQWVVADPVAYLVDVRSPRMSLNQATESSLRHVVGSSAMDDVITAGRAAIAVEVQKRLQSYLDAYGTGIRVDKVNIDRSAPPQQVAEAFNDVQKAKEDEQRLINEANAHAESIIPEARGKAQEIVEQANAYRDRVAQRAQGEADRFNKLYTEYRKAEKVTRDRLYIDAMETMLGNSSKILVALKGGNNVMYLPLDKLTQQASSGGTGGLSQQNVQQISSAILQKLNDHIQSTRARDTR